MSNENQNTENGQEQSANSTDSNQSGQEQSVKNGENIVAQVPLSQQQGEHDNRIEKIDSYEDEAQAFLDNEGADGGDIEYQSRDESVKNDNKDPIELQLEREAQEFKQNSDLHNQNQDANNQPTSTPNSEQEQSASNEGNAKVEEQGGNDQSNQNEGSNRFRLKPADKFEARVFELKKAGLSLTKAMELANEEQGSANGEISEAEYDSGNISSEYDTITQQIEEKWAEKAKVASEDFDFEKVTEIEKEIRQLEKQQDRLENQAQEYQSRQEEASVEAFDSEWDKSVNEANSTYGFVQQQNSAGFQLMQEIEANWLESGNDLYYNANKPLILAGMVAGKLGIAPNSAVRSNAPVVPQPSNQPNQQRQGQQMIASASQRSTNQDTRNATIDQIASEDDYELALRNL